MFWIIIQKLYRFFGTYSRKLVLYIVFIQRTEGANSCICEKCHIPTITNRSNINVHLSLHYSHISHAIYVGNIVVSLSLRKSIVLSCNVLFHRNNTGFLQKKMLPRRNFQTPIMLPRRKFQNT